VELALAIHALTSNKQKTNHPLTIEPSKTLRLGSQIADLLRSNADDSMRQ